MAVVWHFPRMFSKQEGTCKIHRNWGRKRSWWLKTLALKSDDPSSNPRSYMVEEEDDSLKLFPDVHMNIIYTHHTHHTSHISSVKKIRSQNSALRRSQNLPSGPVNCYHINSPQVLRTKPSLSLFCSPESEFTSALSLSLKALLHISLMLYEGRHILKPAVWATDVGLQSSQGKPSVVPLPFTNEETEAPLKWC